MTATSTSAPPAASPLSQSVHCLAAGIGRALQHQLVSARVARGRAGQDGADAFRLHELLPDADAAPGLAAVRVLGADTLAAHVMGRLPLAPADRRLLERAQAAFPLRAESTIVDHWLHWGLERVQAQVTATGSHTDGPVTAVPPPASPPPDGARPIIAAPDSDWLNEPPWPVMTQHLAHLASLAWPGTDAALVQTLTRRRHDLALGFVRAFMRRDWLQAAGAARWLALLGQPPPALRLTSSIDLLLQAAHDDPRARLHLHFARLLIDPAPDPAP
ncbi:hypothetical protein ACFVH6_09770 [Spirillospora sp. NPDC127200]